METDKALEQKQQMQVELSRQIAIRREFSEPESPLSTLTKTLCEEQGGQYDESDIKRAITILLKKHTTYKNINVTQELIHYPESFSISVIVTADEFRKKPIDKDRAQQTTDLAVKPQYSKMTPEAAAIKAQDRQRQLERERQIKDNIEQELSKPKSKKYKYLRDQGNCINIER